MNKPSKREKQILAQTSKSKTTLIKCYTKRKKQPTTIFCFARWERQIFMLNNKNILLKKEFVLQ